MVEEREIMQTLYPSLSQDFDKMPYGVILTTYK